MKKMVSVVVLNWNGKDHLRKCINSLRTVSYKPLEVIVVDNGSSDGSVEMLEKNFPWVKIVKNKKNLGYSKGNNLGILKSKGEYVFILNNDTEVTKNFLESLVSTMESDKTIGCVQPKILYGTDHSMLNAVGSYLTSTGFLYHYGYRKNPLLKQYSVPLIIYSAKGAAMLLRRNLFDKVGMFDEDFFIFFEETDLCHRIWLSGYKVIYQPKSIIYHYEAVDTTRQMKDFTRNYLSFRNRIYSFIKNLEVINLTIMLIALSTVYLWLILYYIVTLKTNLLFAVGKAVVWNVFSLPKILKKRTYIQTKLRKLTDKELFPIIKRDPIPLYYYYLFSTLKNFKGEKPLPKYLHYN